MIALFCECAVPRRSTRDGCASCGRVRPEHRPATTRGVERRSSPHLAIAEEHHVPWGTVLLLSDAVSKVRAAGGECLDEEWAGLGYWEREAVTVASTFPVHVLMALISDIQAVAR